LPAERSVRAVVVVIAQEFGELALKFVAVRKGYAIQELAAHASDEPLDEWMRERNNGS